MPFTGKPSTGCDTCRTRRVKCDETRPTCKRCAKGNRICPGYRDYSVLLFRDQNISLGKRKPQVSRKSWRGSPESRTGSSPEASIEGSSVKGSSIEEEIIEEVIRDDELPEVEQFALALNPKGSTLPPAREQQALCKFVADYVVFAPQQGTTPPRNIRAYLDVLFDIYNDLHVDSALHAAVVAASLANLGNSRNDESVRAESRRMYGKALVRTNRALADPKRATAYDTMMTVHLLSLYETMMCTNRGGWAKHVEGMAGLLRARGPGMLNDSVGLRLFTLLRSQILIDSVEKDKLPMDLLHPRWSPKVFNPHPANGVMGFLARLPLLHGRINALHSRSPSPPNSPDSDSFIDDLATIIADIHTLDEQILSWSRTLPESWYYVVEISPTPLPENDFWNSTYHIYQDAWTSFLWNGYRVARIAVHGILYRLLKLEENKRTIQQMADDICYTVPFNFSYHPGKVKHSPVALGGHFLLWPLAAVCGMEALSERQREWICGRLDYTADVAGVRFASYLKENYRR